VLGVRNLAGLVVIRLLVMEGHFDTIEIPPFRMGMATNIVILRNSLINTSGLLFLLMVSYTMEFNFDE
jgi:hypothetical protein